VTHYDVLGVSEHAGRDELRQAYLDLARRHHPDREPDRARRDAAEIRMREINQAWAVLGDPRRRKLYDAERRTGERFHRLPNSPHPDFVPFDDEDIDYAELLDDTPMEGTHVPRWLQVLPAGLLAVGVLATLAGFIAMLGPLLALGVALVVMAVLAFLAAPAVAVMRSYQHDRR
jgi:curved DNA-binding protein CbpA